MSANQLSQQESAHQTAQSEMWSGIGSAADGALKLAMPLPV